MPSTSTPATCFPTFRQWLATYKRDETPRGDLARDALADHNWRGQHTHESLWRAMNGYHTPCWGAVNAFKEARAEYVFDKAEAAKEQEQTALLATLDEGDEGGITSLAELYPELDAWLNNDDE